MMSRNRCSRPFDGTALLADALQATVTPVDNSRGSKVEETKVTTRRDILQATPRALASLLFVGCNLVPASQARAQARRREVVVNGKRARTIDVHSHCAVPEALALMNLKLGGPQLRPDLDVKAELSTRLTTMDEQGIDVEA